MGDRVWNFGIIHQNLPQYEWYPPTWEPDAPTIQSYWSAVCRALWGDPALPAWSTENLAFSLSEGIYLLTPHWLSDLLSPSGGASQRKVCQYPLSSVNGSAASSPCFLFSWCCSDLTVESVTQQKPDDQTRAVLWWSVRQNLVCCFTSSGALGGSSSSFTDEDHKMLNNTRLHIIRLTTHTQFQNKCKTELIKPDGFSAGFPWNLDGTWSRTDPINSGAGPDEVTGPGCLEGLSCFKLTD